jgi:hypothetical protein
VLKSGEVLGVLDEPPSDPAAYFGVGDFNVGIEVTIYGRVFNITNCDAFTREWLSGLGLEVGEASEVPSDPHKEFLKNEKARQSPHRPYSKDISAKAFLTKDRQVGKRHT